MKKISVLCGVSEGTVSKALCGKTGVGAKTRARIISIADKYNYHPNALVRGMQTGKTMTIGVACNDFGNAYSGSILNGVQKVLYANNYDSLIINWDLSVSENKDILSRFAERRVDGILMFPPAKISAVHFSKLKAINKPVVILDQKWEGWDFDFVGSEDTRGAFTATKYLIKNGHKKIANIYTKSISTGIDRFEGFREAMACYNLPVSAKWLLEFSYKSNIYEQIKNFLLLDDKPDALVCFNDNIAIEALGVAYDLNIKVPEELSIIGFSDMPSASQVRPQLTTLRQDTNLIGQSATELLLERIKSKDISENTTFSPKLIRFPVKLIVRETTLSNK